MEIFRTDELRFGSVTLVFSAAESPTNHLTCLLGVGDVSNEAFFHYRFGIYAYDVKCFMAELEQLHATLEGVAVLKPMFYENDEFLRVSVADPGAGQLVCSGEIVPVPNSDFPSTQLGGILPFSGIRVQFDGLITDQSFIPSFIRQMNMFFQEAEIDTSTYI